jgi:hypothetical protein
MLTDAPKPDWDGSAEFLMPDAGCFAKAMEDPYYKDVMAPDEENLFDMKSFKFMVGWEEVYVEDGKVLGKA